MCLALHRVGLYVALVHELVTRRLHDVRATCRYVATGAIDYSNEPRCAATLAEAAAWRTEQPAAGAPATHFITDCFFLTAHAMHIGAVKMIEQVHDEQRTYQELAANGPAYAEQVSTPVHACELLTHAPGGALYLCVPK